MTQPELWVLLQKRLTERVRVGLTATVVTKFCDIGNDTYNHWLSNKRGPTGLRFIKLWWLLATAGCESPELEELDPIVRLTSELLAFDIMSMENVKETLSLKHDQQVFKALRGDTRPSRPLHNVDEIITLYGQELESAREKLSRQLSRIRGPASKPQGQATPAPQARPSRHATPPDRGVEQTDQFLLQLATYLSAALPLARHATSRRVTPSQRSELRRLVGQENMFALLGELHALQTERALNNRK